MIYVLLANGFEETEAIEPIDIMRRAGLEVTTAAVADIVVTGAHNIPVTADITIDKVKPEEMDLVMLPGGGLGHELLDASDAVHSLLNYAAANNKYIAAICAAPSILGRKQMLLDKNATCFPGFEQYLYGANVKPDKVVVDGKIITGKGAGAAADFGFTIVEILKGKETAESIRAQMQY